MSDDYQIRNIDIDKLADWIRSEGQLGEEPALHLLGTIRVMRQQKLEQEARHAHEIQELWAIAEAAQQVRLNLAGCPSETQMMVDHNGWLTVLRQRLNAWRIKMGGPIS